MLSGGIRSRRMGLLLAPAQRQPGDGEGTHHRVCGSSRGCGEPALSRLLGGLTRPSLASEVPRGMGRLGR